MASGILHVLLNVWHLKCTFLTTQHTHELSSPCVGGKREQVLGGEDALAPFSSGKGWAEDVTALLGWLITSDLGFRAFKR